MICAALECILLFRVCAVQEHVPPCLWIRIAMLLCTNVCKQNVQSKHRWWFVLRITPHSVYWHSQCNYISFVAVVHFACEKYNGITVPCKKNAPLQNMTKFQLSKCVVRTPIISGRTMSTFLR